MNFFNIFILLLGLYIWGWLVIWWINGFLLFIMWYLMVLFIGCMNCNINLVEKVSMVLYICILFNFVDFCIFFFKID